MLEALPDHVTHLWGKETGNLLLRVDGPVPRVLKVFRSRRGRWREGFSSLSHRLFEQKRGVSPEERCETERLSLALWRREGFDVPALDDAPPPAWLPAGLPSLWLEFTPGSSLFWVLLDEQRPEAERCALAKRLGVEHARRHRRALELSEPLLLQEHPTTKHVLVHGERLVTIDLEGGYAPGYSVAAGIALDLAGTLRSFSHGPPDLTAALPAAYLGGYRDRALVEQALAAAFSSTPAWAAWRLSDRLRRGDRGKAGVLLRLRALLASGGPPLSVPDAGEGC